MYSVIRCFVEWFRADSLMFGQWRAAQIVSILLFICAVAVIKQKKLWQAEPQPGFANRKKHGHG